MPGKVDWLAHNLEVEGERVDAPTVGRFIRDDVVRCAPTDRAADVREAIKRSLYPFGLVTSEDDTVLGRVRASTLDADSSEATVGDLAEPGPKTFRPHHSVENVASVLAEKNLRWAIVTTPEGQLLGVASREDLERAT